MSTHMPNDSTDLMQPWALTVDRTLTHAARWHADRELVSREFDGSLSRTTYAVVERRARQLSAALLAAGIGHGDRIATLAMNSADHMTAWFGIMGIGAVCHTVNPRLFDEHLVYIINHAADRWLIADVQFAPLVARLLPQCPTLERVVYFCKEADCPTGHSALVFDTLIAQAKGPVVWGNFNEHSPAALCYTSGTTGNPKGALYTHRSQMLHTMIIQSPDAVALSATDTVLSIVPMFHVNAWGIPFAAATAGARLVLPGARLDGASVYELLEQERVTVSAGVPSVWQLLLEYMARHQLRLSSLRRVIIGGSACPESLIRGFQEGHNVEVIQAWGMTEMSPIGTVGMPTEAIAAADHATRLRYSAKQGRVLFGVDLQITNDDGEVLPRDGHTPGHIQAKGPAVIQRYFRDDKEAIGADGFFDSGDIGTIDPHGYMEITDRAKDLIKSGGEWISSVEIENLAVGHPSVQLAAVIAIPHVRWRERPLLVVQLKEDQQSTPEELLKFLEGKIARWWMPDTVVFVEQIPLGATGKLDKKKLRAQFADFKTE